MCLNGGFCDGYILVKICLCFFGFFGENCRIGDYINVLFIFIKEILCVIVILMIIF